MYEYKTGKSPLDKFHAVFVHKLAPLVASSNILCTKEETVLPSTSIHVLPACYTVFQYAGTQNQ